MKGWVVWWGGWVVSWVVVAVWKPNDKGTRNKSNNIIGTRGRARW